MRIVHTSDWHAGRVWKGLSRVDELAAVLGHLASFVEREKVDVVLMTGDVFDHAAPSPESERVVFNFLKRVGLAGARTVAIAGNHDHPARMDAWGTLTELVGVHTVTRPSGPDAGGVIRVEARSGERAVIGALPFASAGDLLSAMEVAGDETRARQKYADLLRDMISRLASKFERGAVNLLMAHTHLEGAVLARSERPVHCSEQWAALPQAFPAAAQYVALGHIHRPQLVAAASAPTRYAGSPLQLDFGEVGDEKSFVFIDVKPNLPARVELIPYEGAIPLRDVKMSLDEIEARRAELEGAWLRVIVPMHQPDADLAAKVRKLLPRAVDVRVELPEREPRPVVFASRVTSPRDEYAEYVFKKRGREAEPELLDAFDALRAEASREVG